MELLHVVFLCILFATNIAHAQWEQVDLKLPFAMQKTNNTVAGNRNSIKMSLQKTIYKEYEPVNAKFELINKDTKPLEIFYLFDPEFTEAKLKIEDNLGHSWTTHKQDLSPFKIHLDPTNIINPGDTLIITMPINNWGEYLNSEKYIDDRVTGIWGYFPANRKYKAMFDVEGFKSNMVEFEVIPLDNNEEKMMDIFESIRNTYLPAPIQQNIKGTSLGEYLMVANLWTKYWEITWDKVDKYQDLVSDYLDFFKEYPDSYYLYNDRFIAPFVIKLFYKKSDYSSIVDDIQQKNVPFQMKMYFEKRDIDIRINNILKYYKINDGK